MCACVRGSSRYISRFLFCLLCVFPLGPRAKTIFSRSPFFNTCLEHDAQAEPVNTAEFTHPRCLTRIFIIVRCFACSHLWPYILINGSQMSFTKCTKRDNTSQVFFLFFFWHLRRIQRVLQLEAQSTCIWGISESLTGLLAVYLRRMRIKRVLFCLLLLFIQPDKNSTWLKSRASENVLPEQNSFQAVCLGLGLGLGHFVLW